MHDENRATTDARTEELEEVVRHLISDFLNGARAALDGIEYCAVIEGLLYTEGRLAALRELVEYWQGGPSFLLCEDDQREEHAY
jgi:hypothetical protein